MDGPELASVADPAVATLRAGPVEHDLVPALVPVSVVGREVSAVLEDLVASAADRVSVLPVLVDVPQVVICRTSLTCRVVVWPAAVDHQRGPSVRAPAWQAARWPVALLQNS